ncbi:MAG: C1 family peptidase [Rhodocyclales bacterium]|nr:C1 family peptidase [Rhodocyclales bacterium]
MNKNVGNDTDTRRVGRDAFDSRDLIYTPALRELPAELLPNWNWIVPLDQGEQGACTGFGLAAAINYQLASRHDRAPARDDDRVSARMLFQVAKRYDEWAGTDYPWSSARGAMKGWFKTGVCSEKLWPNTPAPGSVDRLTRARQIDALRHPLGAYYRVSPRRSDVHAALVEASTVYAVADTHDGWDQAYGAGAIPFAAGATGGGGHAFAIVGYTAEGFLVQNSWGGKWGGFEDAAARRHPGVALWRYADFDLNVWDLWVARLALPVESLDALAGRGYRPSADGGRQKKAGPSALTIRGHYLHIDDGQFDPMGDYPSHADDLDEIVDGLVNGRDGTPPQHILLYAHGGLNTIEGAASRVGCWRQVFRNNGIAELHFIWETGLLAELRDVLLGKEKFVQERVAGVSSWWDDWVEKASQPLGYPLWQEMLSDAACAFERPAAAGSRFVAKLTAALAKAAQPPKVHLVCHSAGAVWMGHLLSAWQAAGGTAIDKLIFLAPACTQEFFFAHYAPPLAGERVKAACLFQLDDATERADDVAYVYRKSLLYLVSRAYQDKRGSVPLLGLAQYYDKVEAGLAAMRLGQRWSRFVTQRDRDKTAADSHGGFDNDRLTMNTLLELVLGAMPAEPLRFREQDLTGY